MKSILKAFTTLLSYTPFQYFPVKVRKGLAYGAKWTLLPFSSYWRLGGAEPETDLLIKNYGSKPGSSAWDLGAHFGIYTVGMALAVGPAGEVVAFEPDYFSYKRCKKHVEMNRLSWVKVFNAAASAKDGYAALILYQGAGATTSHLAYQGEVVSDDCSKVTIKTLKLDKLVEDGEIRAPDFIKVDVEGHGGEALKGAQNTIKKYRPAILISLHSPSELEGVQSVLKPLGFKAFDANKTPLTWKDCLFKTVICLTD